MTNISLKTQNGRKILLNRGYKSTPDYTVPSVFRVGINQTTPLITDTALDYIIPITNGTINDDGSNTMTGSDGADNSTDNTDTFKPGGGVTDVTAQNLIANDTSVTKVWTIADLDTSGSDAVGTKPYGLWLYIKDATALAKFVSAGTALSIKFRTNGDGATLYYEDAYEDGDLAVGWNWITSNTTNVEDLTEGAGGAPSGDLDEFVITITTNNATDEFAAGDVVYDMLRQWDTTDSWQLYVSGYPTLNETNMEATTRCYLEGTKANGFLIDSCSFENTDGTPLVSDMDKFDEDSKSDTDEFAFVAVDRII